jgi:heterodisulfide reductase subunit C
VHADTGKNLTSDVVRMSGTNVKKCMKCGKCSATCPSLEGMDILPHRFVSMVDEGDVKGLMDSTSLWKCFSCFACVERCPRGVEPAHVIEAVRISAMSRQDSNRMKPDAVPNFLKDLGEAGEEAPQQLLTSAFRKYSK